MDTDSLTEMAYVALIQKPSEHCSYLRSDIANESSEFKNEDEYLLGVSEILEDLIENTEDYLDEWDLQNDPEEYGKGLQDILLGIQKTLKVPVEDRGPIDF